MAVCESPAFFAINRVSQLDQARSSPRVVWRSAGSGRSSRACGRLSRPLQFQVIHPLLEVGQHRAFIAVVPQPLQERLKSYLLKKRVERLWDDRYESASFECLDESMDNRTRARQA